MLTRVISVLFICISTAFADTDIKLPQIKINNSIDISSLVLVNINSKITLRCTANYPILWIYDYDKVARRYISGVTQWVERKFDDFFNTSTYHYEVYFQVSFKIVKSVEYVSCQKVGNASVESTVVIKPSGDGTNLLVERDSVFNATEDEEPSKDCEMLLTVKDLPDGPVWKCETDDGAAGELEFEGCLYGMPCANLFRRIRKSKTCVKVLQPHEVCEPASRCWRNDQPGHALRPTLVHCFHHGVRRALSYFFSFPPDGKPGNHKLHLSWDDTTGKNMLFLDPLPRQLFYVGERVNLTCRVSRYYYSFGYRIGVEVDGALQLLPPDDYSSLDGITNARVATQSIQLIDIKTNALYCFAPIFNSTDWTNKSISIVVKDPIHPYFNSTFETITFKSGATDQNISCEVFGEPRPIIAWHKEHFLNSTRTSLNWTFLEIKPTIEGNYICEARNSIGGYARKVFRVVVADESTKTVWIVGATVSIIVLALVIGLLLAWRKIRRVNEQLRHLTEEEIKEFTEGCANPNPGPDSLDGNAPINCLPYNSAYEILKEQLIIDEKNILGSGTFGIVFKGMVKTPTGPKDVAVKTVKPSVDLIYFKALLSELKIMAYIGNGHDNVVHLLGACTENIRNRDIYIGVELCKTSLVNILRTDKNNFENYVRNGTLLDIKTDTENDYVNKRVKFTTFDLINWSYQIADGMDFISSKHVIHGDLAARNVLLSSNLTAKICDFGLARQLIDYNYIKSESCPLPWKWMAIESLSEMRFSTASDVWAYGVTLWEIFSLGQIPYPGLSWNPDFVNALSGGLRMNIPPYASEQLYQIMLACWEQTRERRPTFKDLKCALQPFLNTNTKSGIQVDEDAYENTFL